jgi:hypothetical protein
MQVKALKTFNGRLGLIRAGVVITVDDRYGKQLIANKLVEVHVPRTNGPDSAFQPGPESNTDLGGPQSTKDGDEGNAEDDDQDGSSDEDEVDQDEETTDEGTESKRSPDDGLAAASSEVLRAGGRGQRSSSRQAGRRSRKKT